MKIPARWRDRIESASGPRPIVDHSLPYAEPLFPVIGLAPNSPCPHYTIHLDEHGVRLRDPDGHPIVETTPVRPGSDFICMVCHSWGHDALLDRLAPSATQSLVVKLRGDAPRDQPTAIRMTQRTYDALARRADGAEFLARVKVELMPDPTRGGPRRRTA